MLAMVEEGEKEKEEKKEEEGSEQEKKNKLRKFGVMKTIPTSIQGGLSFLDWWFIELDGLTRGNRG
jgi:hypothetical protein